MHTYRLRKYIEGKKGRRIQTAETRTKNKDGERERKERKEKKERKGKEGKKKNNSRYNQSIYKHSLLTSITTNKQKSQKVKTNILLRMT